MEQQQRRRLGLRAARVDEVHPRPRDRRLEMLPPVELPLLLPPVEAVQPVLHQRAHLAQSKAAALDDPARPAGGAQTGGEVVEQFLRDGEGERLDPGWVIAGLVARKLPPHDTLNPP